MPLYNFICPQCGFKLKKILSPEQSKVPFFCEKDRTSMARDPQSPTTMVKEVIDNGLQAKRVEQYANSQELFQEREDNARADKNKNEL